MSNVYDHHFWKNGHALNLIVFDDSSPANQQKYFGLLERTQTHNEPQAPCILLLKASLGPQNSGLEHVVFCRAAGVQFRTAFVRLPTDIERARFHASALEKWNGTLPQVTGGAVPFINLPK